MLVILSCVCVNRTFLQKRRWFPEWIKFLCFLASSTGIRRTAAAKQLDSWYGDGVSGHRWGKKTRSSDQTYGLGLTKHYRWRLRAQMVHLLAGGQRWMVKCRVFEYCVKERKTHLCKQINNPSSPVTFLGCRNDILYSFSFFLCIRRSLAVPSQDYSRVNYFFSLSGCLREQTGRVVWANQQAYIYQPPLSFHLGG